MSDGNQRYKQLRSNYEQASNNEENDVDAAKAIADLALARSVSKNVQKARIALANALAAGLEANSQAIETAYESLKEANKAVVEARKGAMAVADLFERLSGATKSATKLAKALEKDSA